MILLVEDNAQDAATIMRILKQHVSIDGLRHTSSITETMELIHNWHGKPLRLILLDLDLDDGSGLELLRQLRAHQATRHVPIVALSEPGDTHNIARSYDLGANSVLSKSDRGERFTDAVEQVAPYWLQLNHAYIQPGVNR